MAMGHTIKNLGKPFKKGMKKKMESMDKTEMKFPDKKSGKKKGYNFAKAEKKLGIHQS